MEPPSFFKYWLILVWKLSIFVSSMIIFLMLSDNIGFSGSFRVADFYDLRP